MSSMRINSPSASSDVRGPGCVRSTTRRVVAEQHAGEREAPPSVFPTPAARARGRHAPARRRARPSAGASPPAAQEPMRRAPWILSARISSGSAPSSDDDPLRVRARRARRRPRARAPGTSCLSRSIRSRLAAHAAGAVVSGDSSRNVRSGSSPLDGGQVELEHPLEAEAAGDALVGERGVDVAVAEHGRAAVERGPDHLVDVLGARGGERARPRPRARRRRRAGRARGPPLRARSPRLARERRRRRPSARSRSASEARPAWSCPDPSSPSKVRNSDSGNLTAREGPLDELCRVRPERLRAEHDHDHRAHRRAARRPQRRHRHETSSRS